MSTFGISLLASFFFSICLRIRLQKLYGWSHSLAEIPGHAILLSIFFIFCVVTTARTYSTMESRWHGYDTISHSANGIYVGVQMHSLYLLYLDEESTIRNKIILAIHHILTSMLYASGRDSKKHFFGALPGLCEISTVFMDIHVYFKKRRIRNFYSRMNYVMFSGTYFLSRIPLFPICFAVWFYDWKALQDSQKAKEGLFISTLYPMCMVFLWIMSLAYMKTLLANFNKNVFPTQKKNLNRKYD